MRHQGNWHLGIVRLCSPCGSASARRLGEQLTHKSGILFKELVGNYRARCAEINMKASGACLNVELCSGWVLASSYGAQRRPPISAMDTNVFSQTTRPIRIKYGMRHQGDEALSVCTLHLGRPRCKAARGQLLYLPSLAFS